MQNGYLPMAQLSPANPFGQSTQTSEPSGLTTQLTTVVADEMLTNCGVDSACFDRRCFNNGDWICCIASVIRR